MNSQLKRVLIQQRARLLAELHRRGVPIPPKEPFDDETTYNNALLELVEGTTEKEDGQST